MVRLVQRSPREGWTSRLTRVSHRYAFSVKNEVQMPDEYDSIVRNLEPFFALPPSVFQERAAKLANEPDFHYSRVSFTMTIKDGQLEVTGPLRFAPRAKELKQLIDGFAEYLPDLQYVLLI